MIRFIPLLAITAIAFFTASCGCKQPVEPPAMRGMPDFKEIPSANEIAGDSEEVPVVGTK